MAEKEGKIVQELRRCLAKDRTLLARHEELLAALQLQLPLSEMKDYRLLEKSLRDTSLGETMLTADSGDAAARAQAKERATQALLACGTQARAAERIVSLLAAALGWDTLRQAPAPVAKPVPLSRQLCRRRRWRRRRHGIVLAGRRGIMTRSAAVAAARARRDERTKGLSGCRIRRPRRPLSRHRGRRWEQGSHSLVCLGRPCSSLPCEALLHPAGRR